MADVPARAGGPIKFQKGNKFGQGSRPKLPPELRRARKENMAGLIRLVLAHWSMTQDQADNRRGQPDVPRIEMAVDSLINAAIEKQDIKCFQFLVEVMCGKIPVDDDEGPEDKVVERIREILDEEKAKSEAIEAE